MEKDDRLFKIDKRKLESVENISKSIFQFLIMFCLLTIFFLGATHTKLSYSSTFQQNVSYWLGQAGNASVNQFYRMVGQGKVW